MGGYAVMFKNTSVLSYRLVLHLFKARILEGPVCEDWSAHTRLSQHCSPYLQQAFSCFWDSSWLHFFCQFKHQLCRCVTPWQSVMSQSLGMTTDKAFQEQCFPWERGAFVGDDFINFQKTFTCTMTSVTHWRMGKKNKKAECVSFKSMKQTSIYLICSSQPRIQHQYMNSPPLQVLQSDLNWLEIKKALNWFI